MSKMLHWDALAGDVSGLTDESLLGSGAFGEVFKVTIENFGPAAVKRIDKGKFSEYIGQWGLQAQALVLEELECGLLLGSTPGVVGAAGLFEDGNFFYLLMPLVTAAKPFEEIKDPFDLLLLLVSLLNTVEQCHAEGVMHRDIREDNVLLVPLQDPQRALGKRGICEVLLPVLLDFSFGIRAKEDDYVFHNFVQKYMPPEMDMNSEGRYGPTVDLFCVGGMGERLMLALIEKRPEIRDLPFVKELYDPFCRKLLSADPQDRLPWREFLLSKVAVAGDLYRESFPEEAYTRQRSDASVTGASKHVSVLKALVDQEDTAVRRCLTHRNSLNESFDKLRAFVDEVKSGQAQDHPPRDSLTFSEGDSVFSGTEPEGRDGFPIDGNAAFLDDGTETFDNRELFAEFGVYHAPPSPLAEEEPQAGVILAPPPAYPRPPRPPQMVKHEPTEVDLGPVSTPTPSAEQQGGWATSDLEDSSPVRVAMERLERVAVARAAQRVASAYQSRYNAAIMEAVEAVDGDM